MHLDSILRPRFVLGAPIYHTVEKTYRIYIPQKGCQISFVCKKELIVSNMMITDIACVEIRTMMH